MVINFTCSYCKYKYRNQRKGVVEVNLVKVTDRVDVFVNELQEREHKEIAEVPKQNNISGQIYVNINRLNIADFQ